MKKFLFNLQVIAIIAFVPAVTYGYLHTDRTKDSNIVKVEKTNDMGPQHQTTGVIRVFQSL